MIDVNADLGGIAEYVGVVKGVVAAIESDIYINYFNNHTMNKLRDRFNAETIAAGMANKPTLQHVFEWPDTDTRGVSKGENSGIPLWRVDIAGRGKARHMSFRFVQSRRNVPLPSPERYGFKPNKLQYMRRHVFKMKAIVMETSNAVTLRPKKKLFIPVEDKPRGYVMTSNAVDINPGGSQATGGFSAWWVEWFGLRGEEIVNEILPVAEKQIKMSAEREMRTIRAGNSRTPKVFTLQTVKAKENSARLRLLADANKIFDGDINDEEDEF